LGTFAGGAGLEDAAVDHERAVAQVVGVARIRVPALRTVPPLKLFWALKVRALVPFLTSASWPAAPSESRPA